MKKRLLTLSLSTALSTALLTTILPTTALYATDLVVVDEDRKQPIGLNPASVDNFFNLDIKPGMTISASVEADDSLRKTHQEVLEAAQKHFQRYGVEFTFGGMDYVFKDGVLTAIPKNGGRIYKGAQEKIDSLEKKLKNWSNQLNTFVTDYVLYRAEARDVELLTLMNVLYANMPWVALRQHKLENVLDGRYVLTMEQITTATKNEARRSQVPITNIFNPDRDMLWMHLAATVVDPSTYEEGDVIHDNIQTFVKGVQLDQTAFKAFFSGILFPNTELSALLKYPSGEHCGLPHFKDSKHQELLRAEAALMMIKFQQYLVDPAAVNELFTTNSEALIDERKKYVESGIENAERPRYLLANRLVPSALERQHQAEAKKAATIALGDFATKDFVTAWITANNERAKANIIRKAEATDALGDFSGKRLIEKWIAADGDDAKAAVVADVKAAATALGDLATAERVAVWVFAENEEDRAAIISNVQAVVALGKFKTAKSITAWIAADGDDAKAEVRAAAAEKAETKKVEAGNGD